MAWKIIHSSFKGWAQHKAEEALRLATGSILGNLKSSRIIPPGEVHFIKLEFVRGGLARPFLKHLGPNAHQTVEQFLTCCLADNSMIGYSGKAFLAMEGPDNAFGEIIVKADPPAGDEIDGYNVFASIEEAKEKSRSNIWEIRSTLEAAERI